MGGKGNNVPFLLQLSNILLLKILKMSLVSQGNGLNSIVEHQLGMKTVPDISLGWGREKFISAALAGYYYLSQLY